MPGRPEGPSDQRGQRASKLEKSTDTGADVEDGDAQIGRMGQEPDQPGGDGAQAEEEHPGAHHQDAGEAAFPKRYD